MWITRALSNMATAKIPFNQSQFVNSNLQCNGTDNSQLINSEFQANHSSFVAVGSTPFYLTRTSLNATTGQSENDTFLQM